VARLKDDYRQLTGPQKAAIFLLSLSEQHAGKLFEAMEEQEIRELSQSMAGLGNVSAGVVERLFVEFADQLSGSGSLVGSMESTERLLGRFLGRDRVDQIMEEIRGPAGRGVQLNAGASAAQGQWLWFVHADSILPTGFLERFHELDLDSAVVGGSFRFALDSLVWQARLWERGVALRVGLFGLPYGDQGLFVRRAVFERMNGFRPIPLMEDVEFVGRLKREGRIRHLKEHIITSARRWEQEGWWRRTRGNLGLLALYYVGVSPEQLARRYEKKT